MLKEFLEKTHTKERYIEFCREYVLASRDGTEYIGWLALFNAMEEQDFFTAPASTKYHGSQRGGLVRHSLCVLSELDTLAEAWELSRDSDYIQEAIYAAFFHDVCKVNLYVEKQLWRKDSNGRWEGYQGYVISDAIVQIGHGEESLRIIEQYVRFKNEGWAQAVRWHMGMPDDYTQSQQYMRAAEKYPEVLALHPADMRATLAGF